MGLVAEPCFFMVYAYLANLLDLGVAKLLKSFFCEIQTVQL